MTISIARFLATLFESGDYVTIGTQVPGRRGIDGRTFRTDTLPNTLAYLAMLDDGQQVHYGVLPRNAALTDGKKGGEAEMLPGHVAWVDVDCQDNPGLSEEDILARLHPAEIPPSIVVHSGHGFHAYWLLDQRHGPADIKRVNEGLRQRLALRVDSAQSSDHLLRLPGSMNLKDPAHPKPCEIVEWESDRRYGLADLPQVDVAKAAAITVRAREVSPERQRFLAGLLPATLPPEVRHMLATGERCKDGRTIAAEEDRSVYIQTCVAALMNQGWTDRQIADLFLSEMKLKAVEVFREKYVGREEEELNRSLTAAHTGHDALKLNGHVLPRLLDRDHQLGKRLLVPVEANPHPCLECSPDLPELRQLATVAQDLYDGARTGCYLAPVAMGKGKTEFFLLPFVLQCAAESLVSGKGIIVAVERRKEAKEYADAINTAINDSLSEMGAERRDVAFALFSHDPDECPEGCKTYHTAAWHDQAKQVPVLFMTHAMLALRGTEPYRRWDGGDRVLCLIDEKPAAWWGKGSLTAPDLNALPGHDSFPGILAARALLDAPEGPVMLTEGLTGPQRAYLRDHIRAITDDTERGRCETALTNLTILSEHGGFRGLNEHGERCVLVARKGMLPDLPTLILDATGVFDPEYPDSVAVLDVENTPMTGVPWEDIRLPARITNYLLVREHTVSKSTLAKKPEVARRVRAEIGGVIRRLLDTLTAKEKVYVVSAKKYEPDFMADLKAVLSATDYARLIFGHYGNTKGSNLMREASAVVFTSVQFKPDSYYRALALAAGRGNPAAHKHLVGRKVLRFMDADVEELKLRDQITTVLQEIGRTRIREGLPVTIYLPWVGEQERAALVAQLHEQFGCETEIVDPAAISPSPAADRPEPGLIAGLRERVAREDWSHKGGDSERRVLGVLLDLATGATISVSRHMLVERTDLALNTVKVAVKRLQRRGWLHVERAATATEAVIYRLTRPDSSDGAGPEAALRAELIRVLESFTVSTAELAKIVGHPEDFVRRQLTSLEAGGLVHQEDCKWTRAIA